MLKRNVTLTIPKYKNVTFFVLIHSVCLDIVIEKSMELDFHCKSGIQVFQNILLLYRALLINIHLYKKPHFPSRKKFEKSPKKHLQKQGVRDILIKLSGAQELQQNSGSERQKSAWQSNTHEVLLTSTSRNRNQ